MHVGFVQWPDGLVPHAKIWTALAADVAKTMPDILVTNEMPFGSWLAASARFDAQRAAESVRLHEEAMEALQALSVPIVIFSRPIVAGGRLANEAFILECGSSRSLHQKHFFPAEEGWFETEWFTTSKTGFEVMAAGAGG